MCVCVHTPCDIMGNMASAGHHKKENIRVRVAFSWCDEGGLVVNSFSFYLQGNYTHEFPLLSERSQSGVTRKCFY